MTGEQVDLLFVSHRWPSDYLRSFAKSATDRAGLDAAVERWTDRWRPERIGNYIDAMVHIDLISVFTPESGIEKALIFLMLHLGKVATRFPKPERVLDLDLEMELLYYLRSQFPFRKVSITFDHYYALLGKIVHGNIEAREEVDIHAMVRETVLDTGFKPIPVQNWNHLKTRLRKLAQNAEGSTEQTWGETGLNSSLETLARQIAAEPYCELDWRRIYQSFVPAEPDEFGHLAANLTEMAQLGQVDFERAEGLPWNTIAHQGGE